MDFQAGGHKFRKPFILLYELQGDHNFKKRFSQLLILLIASECSLGMTGPDSVFPENARCFMKIEEFSCPE